MRVLQRISDGGLSPHSFKLFTYYDYFSDWSVNWWCQWINTLFCQVQSLVFFYLFHSHGVWRGILALTSREHFAPLHPRSGNGWWRHSARPHSSLWSPCICGSGHHCTLWVMKEEITDEKAYDYDLSSNQYRKKNEVVVHIFHTWTYFLCIALKILHYYL